MSLRPWVHTDVSQLLGGMRLWVLQLLPPRLATSRTTPPPGTQGQMTMCAPVQVPVRPGMGHPPSPPLSHSSGPGGSAEGEGPSPRRPHSTKGGATYAELWGSPGSVGPPLLE